MNYHKYVIEDGKLVGKFEEMYQNIEDPWNQTKKIMSSLIYLGK